jgi:hypothetical protein
VKRGTAILPAFLADLIIAIVYQVSLIFPKQSSVSVQMPLVINFHSGIEEKTSDSVAMVNSFTRATKYEEKSSIKNM